VANLVTFLEKQEAVQKFNARSGRGMSQNAEAIILNCCRQALDSTVQLQTDLIEAGLDSISSNELVRLIKAEMRSAGVTEKLKLVGADVLQQGSVANLVTFLEKQQALQQGSALQIAEISTFGDIYRFCEDKPQFCGVPRPQPNTSSQLSDCTIALLHFCMTAVSVIIVVLQLLVLITIFNWASPSFVQYCIFGSSENLASTRITDLIGAAALGMTVIIIASFLGLVLAKWLLVGKFKAGVYAQTTWYYQRWLFMNQLWDQLKETAAPCDLAMHALVIAMGAKYSIAQGSLCNSGCELDLLTVEHNTDLRGAEVQMARVVANPIRLELGAVSIGANSFIGHRCIVEPNTDVAPCTFIDPLHVVPAGAKLPNGRRWTGHPLRDAGPSTCQPGEQWNLLNEIIMTPLKLLTKLASSMVGGMLFIFAISYASGGSLDGFQKLLLLFGYFSVVLPGLSLICKWTLHGRTIPGSVQKFTLWYKVKVLCSLWHDGWMFKVLHYHMVYGVWLVRLAGAQIGTDTHIIGAPYQFTPQHGLLHCDMLHVGCNAELSASEIIPGMYKHDGKALSIEFQPVTIGDGASVGFGAMLMGGVHLEEGAAVGRVTVVPNGMRVRRNHVVTGNPAFQFKNSNQTPPHLLGASCSHSFVNRYILSLTIRLSLVMAIFGAPTVAVSHGLPILLETQTWAFDVFITPIANGSPFSVAPYFVLVIVSWCTTMLVSATAVQRFVFAPLHTGTGAYNRNDLGAFLYHTDGTLTNCELVMPPKGTWSRNLFLKYLFGTHIKNCTGTRAPAIFGKCYEPDKIHIGDGAVLGHCSVKQMCGGAAGHIYEHGALTFNDAHIGDDSTVLCSYVWAGESVPKEAVLGSFSSIMTPLDPGCTYIGMPAKEAQTVLPEPKTDVNEETPLLGAPLPAVLRSSALQSDCVAIVVK